MNLRQMTDEELTALTVILIRNGLGLLLFVLLMAMLGRTTVQDLIYVLRHPRVDIIFTILIVGLAVGCVFFFSYFLFHGVRLALDFKARQVYSLTGLVVKKPGWFKSFEIGGQSYRVHSQDYGTFNDGDSVRVILSRYAKAVIKIYRND